MSMVRASVVLVLIGFVSAGCTPGIRVVKSPKDNNKGIRYYRPKPYLFLSPAGETKLDDKGKPASISPSDQYVNIELRYLPDFSEEYSISVTPGLGTAEVNIGLEDGWNLTSINQKLDSQFDENLTAIAKLTEAAGGVIGTAGGDAKAGDTEVIATNVTARNVPLGFYEAAIGRDNCGRKQMYGWRYIGFTPFAPCPLYPNGCQRASCHDGSLELFGLVFENGVMTFRHLSEVQHIPREQTTANRIVTKTVPPKGEEFQAFSAGDIEEHRRMLESELRDGLNDGQLRVESMTDDDDGVTVFTIYTRIENTEVVREAKSILFTNRAPFVYVEAELVTDAAPHRMPAPQPIGTTGRVQINEFR